MAKGFINSLVNIVFPKHCLICHNHLKSKDLDSVICLGCWHEIKRITPPFCRRCGRTLPRQYPFRNICPKCQRTNFSFDRALSACSYEGIVKELIAQFKYKGKDYIGKTLSQLLIEFINQYGLQPELFDSVMPIPLCKRKLREREFNQAEIIGKILAYRFNIEFLTKELVRNRDTATQTDLSDSQRWENLKGSFSVKNASRLKGKNILLVDDVITTGATCSEASSALKQAGAGVVFVLTIAN